MNLYIAGVICFWIGFLFNIAETWYFGWNLRTSCPEEMICDFIAHGFVFAGLCVVGWVFVNKPYRIDRVENFIVNNAEFQSPKDGDRP